MIRSFSLRSRSAICSSCASAVPIADFCWLVFARLAEPVDRARVPLDFVDRVPAELDARFVWPDREVLRELAREPEHERAPDPEPGAAGARCAIDMLS